MAVPPIVGCYRIAALMNVLLGRYVWGLSFSTPSSRLFQQYARGLLLCCRIVAHVRYILQVNMPALCRLPTPTCRLFLPLYDERIQSSQEMRQLC